MVTLKHVVREEKTFSSFELPCLVCLTVYSDYVDEFLYPYFVKLVINQKPENNIEGFNVERSRSPSGKVAETHSILKFGN